VKEVGFSMITPVLILALLCVLFGVFAYSIPLKHFLLPAVSGVEYIGFWSPGLATIMILIGVAIGLLIYLAGNLKGIREADTFIGGEKIPVEERVTGTGFYHTIRQTGFIRTMYNWAEAKFFDIYDQGSRLFFSIAGLFRRFHTGGINFYMTWVFIGMITLLIVLMGR
jgi:hypothetical protein